MFRDSLHAKMIVFQCNLLLEFNKKNYICFISDPKSQEFRHRHLLFEADVRENLQILIFVFKNVFFSGILDRFAFFIKLFR